MTKSPEQPSENIEWKTSSDIKWKNQRFEELVEGLVAQSSLFPEKQLSRDTRLGIIEAIENNKVTLYLGNSASDRVLDSVHCLVEIYDELGKDKPDEDFLSSTVEQLKEYL